MKFGKKVVRVFLSNWMAMPVRLLGGIIVARWAGAEGRGMQVILLTAVTLLATVGMLGLHAAATYHVRKQIYTERTMLVCFLPFIAGFTVLYGLLGWMCQGFIWRLLFTEGAPDLLLLWLGFVLLPFVMAGQYFSNLLLAQGRTKTYARYTVGVALVTLGTAVALVVGMGWGIKGAVVSAVVGQVLPTVYLAGEMFTNTRGQATDLSGRMFSAMFRYGLQHYLKSVGAMIFKRLDSLLLAHFLDVKAVGYYSVASMAYEALLTVPKAANGLLNGEAAGKDEQRAAKFVARASRHLVAIMLGMAVLAAVAVPWFVPLVYGPDFAQSVPPLLVLLGASVIWCLTIALETYFLGVGRPGINGMITLGAGAMNLVLSLILIPRFGLVGNAVATLLGALVASWFHVVWFCRLSGASWGETLWLRSGELGQLFRRLRPAARLS